MGAKEKVGAVFSDLRGQHIKLFGQAPERIVAPGYEVHEVFYTVSHKNVIRGMHLQENPAQPKIITVVTGAVDVRVLCLDPEDESFGQVTNSLILREAADGNSDVQQLWVPAKHALGYHVLEDSTRVLYLAGSDFNPSGDIGIHPFGAGVDLGWTIPQEEAILSPRDQELPSFAEYLGL